MDCPKRRCDTEAVAGLPDDPLVEILSRVPVKSICRCKCVSKAWRDLIADPLHRKKLPQTLEGFFFMELCSSLYFDDNRGCGNGDCKYCTDGSDVKGLPCYGFFDVLQRSVRPVDFSYLTELPGIKSTRLLQCCNGLLLFAVQYNSGSSWSFAVCNPATRQCVAVPSYGLTKNVLYYGCALTYLLFDPEADPWHFNLLQLWQGVHVYSSKTQAWSSHSQSDWSIRPSTPGVYVNGMLHVLSWGEAQLTVFDVEGNIQKIIPAPCQAGREDWTKFDYIGQSQGCFYYISHETPDDEEIDDESDTDGDSDTDSDGFGHTEPSFHGLLIWVLEDYERQQWVLKDTVSFDKLFGERGVDNKDIGLYYAVVGIHPDHSLVFLIWDQELISYHMDSKEVCDLCTLGPDLKRITPYVPCFSELLAVENKQ